MSALAFYCLSTIIFGENDCDWMKYILLLYQCFFGTSRNNKLTNDMQSSLSYDYIKISNVDIFISLFLKYIWMQSVISQIVFKLVFRKISGGATV